MGSEDQCQQLQEVHDGPVLRERATDGPAGQRDHGPAGATGHEVSVPERGRRGRGLCRFREACCPAVCRHQPLLASVPRLAPQDCSRGRLRSSPSPSGQVAGQESCLKLARSGGSSEGQDATEGSDQLGGCLVARQPGLEPGPGGTPPIGGTAEGGDGGSEAGEARKRDGRPTAPETGSHFNLVNSHTKSRSRRHA